MLIIEERTALSKLKHAGQASFSAEDRPQCLEGTSQGVLDSLRAWAESEKSPQFFWLNGPAGSGKSTIAQTFAYLLHSKDKLGASFFCSRNMKERKELTMIFPTIAFQLATSTNMASPKFRNALLRALEPEPDGMSLSPRNQLQNLVIRPAKVSGMKTIIIIDALDECSDDSTVSTLLSLLADVTADLESMKFFITSRPEPGIRSSFHCKELSLHTGQQSLNDVPTAIVDKDIKLFLQVGLRRLASTRYYLHLPFDWPPEDVIDGLTAKAAGLFIFAATVLKFVDDAHYDPRDQLEKVSSNSGDFRIEGSQGLDKLYADILSHAIPERDDHFSQQLLNVLGLLVVARDTLPSTVIASLLGFRRDTDVLTTLDSLHSLIVVPEDPTLPVRFQHKSFPDFLTDTTRCTDSRFQVNRDDHHFNTGHTCLSWMERLKKNICGLPRYSLNIDVKADQLREHIDELTRYCCRFWADHLLSSNHLKYRFIEIQPRLLNFLSTRQLQWFEVLGLLQELRHAVSSLSQLREWIVSVSAHLSIDFVPLNNIKQVQLNGQYQDILDWVID